VVDAESGIGPAGELLHGDAWRRLHPDV
jgi:hypothetical protein